MVYSDGTMSTSLLLRIASVISVLFATVVVGMATPAFADSPSTWNAGPSRTPLENLVFFGGAVVGLIVLITLFALLTSRNNFRPEPPEPGTDLENPDFCALAEAYGALGETVTDTEAFPDALDRALTAGRPALLDLRVDPEAIAPGLTLSALRRR